MHLGRLLLSRESLEAPGELLRLLGQLALRPPSTPARGAGLPALAGALIFLLLPSGQALESLQRFIHFAVRLLLGATLHLLILVTQFVRFQLEQVGQVLGVRLAPAATAAATTLHADLHLLEHRFRTLQQLQRPLLRRQRIRQLAVSQLLLGELHFCRRLR